MRQVLIVEDHPLVAEATGNLLVQYGDDVSIVVCTNAAQAREKLDDAAESWFRVFLDLDVPGAYGLSLAREVKQRGLANLCCVVSAFERADYVEEICAHGFLGYIVKAMPVEDFAEAVTGILEGVSYFSSMPLTRRASAARLTRRQTEILELIRRGLSSKEIAAELHLAEGTVNNQVRAVLQILEVGSRAHAIAKAIEMGLLEPQRRESADYDLRVQRRDAGDGRTTT